jgi:hypothetical protein
MVLSFAVIDKLSELIIGDVDNSPCKYLTDKTISQLVYAINCAEEDYHRIVFGSRKDRMGYTIQCNNNIVALEKLFTEIKREHKYLIDRLNKKDYNGVYTRARTMIDSVFDQLYNKLTGKNFAKGQDGFLDKWGWVKKDGLKLIPSNCKNPHMRNLAQSFGTIITNINDLRNDGSDAHSNTSIKELPKHHVELMINSAVSLSLFLLSSCDYQYNSNHVTTGKIKIIQEVVS